MTVGERHMVLYLTNLWHLFIGANQAFVVFSWLIDPVREADPIP